MSSNQELIRNIYAKYNELESLKKYTTDEMTLKIIEAKQETLDDITKLVNSKITSDILNIC